MTIVILYDNKEVEIKRHPALNLDLIEPAAIYKACRNLSKIR